MTTATEEHGHHTTEELEAELEDVRRELEAKRRSSGGWHLTGSVHSRDRCRGFRRRHPGVQRQADRCNRDAQPDERRRDGRRHDGKRLGYGDEPAERGTRPRGQGAARRLDYWVKPSETSVPAGKVTFDATNVGQLPHELMIEPMPMKMDAPGQPNEEAAQGMIEDMNPGESGSMTLDLKPGTYTLFCNVAGHYAMGQHTMFKVTG